MISKEERNIIKRMYNRIYSHKSIKDLTGNSLLITLFAMRDSNRYRVTVKVKLIAFKLTIIIHIIHSV